MVNDRPYDYIVSIPKIEQNVKLQGQKNWTLPLRVEYACNWLQLKLCSGIFIKLVFYSNRNQSNHI